MGRHADGIPIEPTPGQAPYGVDGPPARLHAGYLRRQEPDRLVEGIDPLVRVAKDLSRWEKAVVLSGVLPVAAVFVFLLPAWGVHGGWAYWGGWLLMHGPLYWAAEWYAAHHEPWAGPRWLRRAHPN